MAEITLAETIKEVCRKHLEEGNGILMGQCITAVGWVNGTVPDCRNIVELPMSEGCAAGIAVGVAMTGRRPIFVVRFQDFMSLNGSPFLNYAAKSKDLHGRATPVFIRALASEAIGPVHSGVLHSMFMHFPGIRAVAPMTPGEYHSIWAEFMENDDPMYVSEHRVAFNGTGELPDSTVDSADVTLFGISAPRFELDKAAELLRREGVKCNVRHIFRLKPFVVEDRFVRALRSSRAGLVVDAAFPVCSAARSIAYDLECETNRPVRALGISDRTKCLCEPLQNRYPDAQAIAAEAKRVLLKISS